MTDKITENTSITLYDYETGSVIAVADEEDDESGTGKESVTPDTGVVDQGPSHDARRNSDLQMDEDDLFTIMLSTDTLTREIITGSHSVSARDTEPRSGDERFPIESFDESLQVLEVEGFEDISPVDFLDAVKVENDTRRTAHDSNIPKEREQQSEALTSNDLEPYESCSDEQSSCDEEEDPQFDIDDLNMDELDSLAEELEIAQYGDLNDEPAGFSGDDGSTDEGNLAKPTDVGVMDHDSVGTSGGREVRSGLTERERKSIEEDIVPVRSLVIEEKVEDIQQKLLQIWRYRRPAVHSHAAETASKGTPRYYATQPAARILRPPDVRNVPKPGLSDTERHSIEEDIQASSSIVIEENVRDIHDHLMKLWKRYTTQFTDISDQVIVFNDERDVERFISQFDSIQQQEDMRKLLAYFEGMFRELPESMLSKFARSEYYTIFTRLLNQLEVRKNETRR